MSEPTCPINFCGRPVGIGTHAQIGTRGDSTTFPVCEEHWLALRDIFPLALTPRPARTSS